MKKRKLNLKNALLSLLVFVVSCSSVPSIYVCTRIDAVSGKCVNTTTEEVVIINDEQKLNNQTWLDISIDSVILPTESWVKIKSYILKQCKSVKSCNKEYAKWQSKLDQL